MTAKRPNIILIVSDDHGREALGCYGNPAVSTPNLDALARDGVRFTQAFCTTASCAASRSVLLTGRHNHANGTYGHTHGTHHFSCFGNERTLPAFLNGGGYRTGRVGKQHYAPVSIFPFQEVPGGGEFGRDDVAMAEACRGFVRSEAPFFLYWCSHNPHRSQPMPDHPCKADAFGNPRRAFAGDVEQPFDPDAVAVPPFLSDTPEVRAELAQYYQSIARLDRGVGRLVQILKEEGRYDDTILVYLADNGAAFPQAKTTLYEPGMRLPLIVRSPFHGRGRTCDHLVSWTDILPTVLEWAGIAVPADARLHGRSFASLLDGSVPTGWTDEVYASHTFHEITNYYPMRVVRTPTHKFIWNVAWKLDYSFASDLWESASWQAQLRSGGACFGHRTVDAYLHRPRFELYDLRSDPGEVRNLADAPEHAPLVAGFVDKLQRFQRETDDPWLHKWTYE